MPHVVLKGTADLGALATSIAEIMDREEDRILKTTRAYRSIDGNTLLLEALAIETGEQRPFFAIVDTRDDGFVVRLHEQTEVEKTDGVKRLLALVAQRILEAEQGLSVGETNLGDYLEV